MKSLTIEFDTELYKDFPHDVIAGVKKIVKDNPNVDIFIIDFNGDPQIDSIFIGMLIYLKLKISEKNKKLQITNIGEPLINFFKVIKIDGYFEII